MELVGAPAALENKETDPAFLDDFVRSWYIAPTAYSFPKRRSMKRILVPLFLLFLTSAAAQDLPRLPDETMTLIGEARALAPEFSSDVL